MKYGVIIHDNPDYIALLGRGSDSQKYEQRPNKTSRVKRKVKVTQTYMPYIGEDFNLRQFLWMEKLQPYLRQLGIFILLNFVLLNKIIAGYPHNWRQKHRHLC